jgi:excisionase family DNA binding protein
MSAKNGADEVWTVKELADRWRVHTSTIYRMMQKQGLPGFKVGGDHRFRRSSIEKWLEEQEAKSVRV